MPAKKRASKVRMTDGQAQYVLRRLIENGTVNSKDVSAVAAQIQNEIESLEEQLQMLRQASGGVARLSAGVGRPRSRSAEGADGRSKPTRRRRRKQTLTPERRAKLKLQGHYLALMRRTPKNEAEPVQEGVQGTGTRSGHQGNGGGRPLAAGSTTPPAGDESCTAG